MGVSPQHIRKNFKQSTTNKNNTNTLTKTQTFWRIHKQPKHMKSQNNPPKIQSLLKVFFPCLPWGVNKSKSNLKVLSKSTNKLNKYAPTFQNLSIPRKANKNIR